MEGHWKMLLAGRISEICTAGLCCRAGVGSVVSAFPPPAAHHHRTLTVTNLPVTITCTDRMLCVCVVDLDLTL